MLVRLGYGLLPSKILKQFPRDQLRKQAKALDVPRGRDKGETIVNLLNSGKLLIDVRFPEILENTFNGGFTQEEEDNA